MSSEQSNYETSATGEISASEASTVQSATEIAKPKQSFAKRAKKFWPKFWRYFKWILLVLAIFTVLAVVSVYNEKRDRKLSKHHLDRIQSLLQYASKSADEAERVADEDAIQALLHADYAVTYFSAAKHIVDKRTIESLIGTNLDELEQYLRALQQRLIARVYAQQNA